MLLKLPWGDDKLNLNVPNTWTLHFPERENTVKAGVKKKDRSSNYKKLSK